MTKKNTVTKLITLRNKIDKLDTNLINLLSERLKLVKKIGILKSFYGFPIYIPEREKLIIDLRSKEAQKLGVSPNLIKDILYRIMYESYINENENGFRTLNPDLKKILIIGGRGGMGQLFKKMLILSGYKVNILEKEDWNKNIDSFFLNVKMVIISVPISSLDDVIKKLPVLSKECILVDVTSIKNEPIQKMLKKHNGPVLGLHPMFSPENNILAKKIIIYCNGRYPESYNWFLKQIKIWGVKLKCMDKIEHDKYMSFIQSLRYFSILVHSFNLSTESIKVKELLKFSSPAYNVDLIMTGRFFSQNPDLYADILMSSHNNIKLIKNYLKKSNYILSLIEQKNKTELIKLFYKIKHWFKFYIKSLYLKSNNILRHINN
ncbi:bifunctional chorismate mutase/prephenate dehydrogenase [Enterobacteriaceae endosymbiont of Plateumaris consimilis]|uniref:bifunctional chorismate mutase/prephenate dehydrogenase n=1 Tax=Enterobacteriaceae endosymbiont of Plateumaris consimilis TaxID=2675794 RepID=UPI001448BE57|nr:bifunctional chorismate mutase/prephenate dehydrogenase [Enterobacteriaceae endosymbiont of Plateumaris consimilis]QJC28781.1 bifunctional chorismate mutase/prephenate dehydrogenase [Enterobacteriaceae endosymbiont of Plateumaris consimilis]